MFKYRVVTIDWGSSLKSPVGLAKISCLYIPINVIKYLYCDGRNKERTEFVHELEFKRGFVQSRAQSQRSPGGMEF